MRKRMSSNVSLANTICLALVLVLSLLLSACGLFGKDETWVQPAPLPKVKPIHHLSLIWEQKLGGGAVDLSLPPSYAEGRLYVVNGAKQVSSVDATTGQLLWQQDLDHDLTTPVAVSAKAVFVASADGWVIALNRADGHIQWQHHYGTQILAKPLVLQDKLVIKSINGDVDALQLQTGKKIWHYHHDEPVLVLRRASQVKVLDDQLVAGFADGQLVLLDGATGKLIWQRPLTESVGYADVERMTDIDADPLVLDDGIIAASYQGHISSVTRNNGHTLWKQPLSSYTGLALRDHMIYISDVNSAVAAYHVDTGEVLWRREDYAYRQITAPVVFGEYLLLGDAMGYLHVLDQQKGTPETFVQVGDAPLLAPPLVIDKRIVVVDNTGRLLAYQLS